MELKDALKSLHAAGRSGEVAELLDAEAEKATGAYREIKADRSRNEDYTRRALAQHYVGTRRAVEKQIMDMGATAARSDRGDAEAVFGVRGLPGDAASLVISRRDAADRVANVEDHAELRQLLTRATRAGDEVLARAVAERAVERQDADTMNQFLGDRPELDAAGQRLWNAERAGDGSLATTVQLAALRPDELSGMDRGSIEYLASNEPTGPTAADQAGVFSR
jgi:hypothetical protein